MNKYSVLLLYPEYLSHYGATYYAHVEARCAELAVIAAREALSAEEPDLNTEHLANMKPVLVIQGHHENEVPA